MKRKRIDLILFRNSKVRGPGNGSRFGTATRHDCYGRSWSRDIFFALCLNPKVHIWINTIIMVIIIIIMDKNSPIILFTMLC